MSKKFFQVSVIAFCCFAIDAARTQNPAAALSCYADLKEPCQKTENFQTADCEVFKEWPAAKSACEDTSGTRGTKCAAGCDVVRLDEKACEGPCTKIQQ